MIYLDTSALAKLLIVESETSELQAWLTEHADRREHAVTSALTRVELMRAIARHGDTGLAERARYLLDGVDIMPITAAVVALAETIGPPTLRSLDAIHLASATLIKTELTSLVTYDNRLSTACREAGFEVRSPGALA